MEVIYDITTLAWGYYRPAARTGIFRVVEHVALGLIKSGQCDVTFSTSASFEELSDFLDYVHSEPRFSGVPVLYPRVPAYICRGLTHRLHDLNQIKRPGLMTKAFRRALNKTRQIIQSHSTLLDKSDLDGKDIFHSPFGPLPEIVGRSTLKRFRTVYDLIPLLYPQFFQFQGHNLIRKTMEQLTSEDWVICISNSTKNDFCNYTGFDPNRVFVTHLAASQELFYQCLNPQQIDVVRRKYHIPDGNYILSVNTLEPRKNMDHVIRSFARLVIEEHIPDLYFVLVGPHGWDYSKIYAAISEHDFMKNRIILTGYVEDMDLAALYSGSLAFVYPSFYEGFGLPPLEAMQCGVPIITSNTSSLPEVVGDAGVLVDPTDMEELCKCMLQLFRSPTLRAAMSKKSLKRAMQFSWAKCTDETIAAYKKALVS